MVVPVGDAIFDFLRTWTEGKKSEKWRTYVYQNSVKLCGTLVCICNGVGILHHLLSVCCLPYLKHPRFLSQGCSPAPEQMGLPLTHDQPPQEVNLLL